MSSTFTLFYQDISEYSKETCLVNNPSQNLFYHLSFFYLFLHTPLYFFLHISSFFYYLTVSPLAFLLNIFCCLNIPLEFLNKTLRTLQAFAKIRKYHFRCKGGCNHGKCLCCLWQGCYQRNASQPLTYQNQTDLETEPAKSTGAC